MYENVRAVVWGLILSLVFTISAGIVAVIDPFNNGVPWVNWLAMTVASTVAVVLSIIIVTSADSEGEYWSGVAASVAAWVFFAGFVVGIMTASSNGGLKPEYHALAWTIFAIPLAVLPLSGLVQYLAAATAQVRNNGQVRRIA